MPNPAVSDDLAREAGELYLHYGDTASARRLGITRGSFQARVRAAKERGFIKGAAGSSEIKEAAPVFTRKLVGERFFITAAQNATPVSKPFLQSLLVACKQLKATLVVVPLRYKNPTSFWSSKAQDDDWWDPSVVPYLCNERKKLCKHLMLLGDVKTQPTAEQPLSGFETMTHGESGILAHPRLQFKTVPTPRAKTPKILTTTGAVTVSNYTDSKAGKKGEFHHTFGACFVEIRGDRFHLRQINAAADGSFIDLDKHYSPEGAKPAESALALIMGDTHVDFIDPKVEEATFGKRGIIETLRPVKLVWHDVLDGYSRNPHHRGNVFNEIAKRSVQRHLVGAEVARAIEFLAKKTPKQTQSVVVSSNHDDFLARWIKDTDWRYDSDNAEFYMETALAMVRSAKLGTGGLEVTEPFSYWVGKSLPGVRCLRRDESFEVAGIELGFHGDRGPNGARGSLNNMKAIGPKVVIGHSHSPGIEQGAYQTGTSTRLALEYNSGPSSWLHTHCVIYANGKRCLINIIDGVWR